MARKSPLQQHGSGRTWAVRLLIVALVVVSGYLVFEFGRIKAGYDIVDAGNTSQAYEDRIAGLNLQIVDLKQEIAVLETNREVDREHVCSPQHLHPDGCGAGIRCGLHEYQHRGRAPFLETEGL